MEGLHKADAKSKPAANGEGEPPPGAVVESTDVTPIVFVSGSLQTFASFQPETPNLSGSTNTEQPPKARDSSNKPWHPSAQR